MAKQKGTLDRPYWSALEVDGDTVRLRLTAERRISKTPVHVDWVRFTVLRRNVDALDIDTLFPLPKTEVLELTQVEMELAITAKRLPLDDLQGEDDFAASHEAMELAIEVSAALGKQFSVFPEPKKGMDFYKYRYSIELNGAECGWVGFLAASNSPHQAAQSKSLHVNIHGMACTFADTGWRDKIADICDDLQGKMTRVDLALDFFDGLNGGIEAINQDYKDGLCNVGGRKLKCNLVGDWNNGHDRSLYIGSRDSGKITNIYEKGDQLYGEKFNSEWLRIELRYGNQVRVLCSDMLRRPADFFMGASDWHMSILLLSDAIAIPEPVARNARLPIESVKAEVSRSLKWLHSTAAASLAVAFEYLGVEDFVSIVTNQKLPGRLSKFSREAIQEQMKPAFELSSIFKLTKCPGTHATFTVDSCPAIA
jgi:phage replication initiation protein